MLDRSVECLFRTKAKHLILIQVVTIERYLINHIWSLTKQQCNAVLLLSGNLITSAISQILLIINATQNGVEDNQVISPLPIKDGMKNGTVLFVEVGT